MQGVTSHSAMVCVDTAMTSAVCARELGGDRGLACSSSEEYVCSSHAPLKHEKQSTSRLPAKSTHTKGVTSEDSGKWKSIIVFCVSSIVIVRFMLLH